MNLFLMIFKCVKSISMISLLAICCYSHPHVTERPFANAKVTAIEVWKVVNIKDKIGLLSKEDLILSLEYIKENGSPATRAPIDGYYVLDDGVQYFISEEKSVIDSVCYKIHLEVTEHFDYTNISHGFTVRQMQPKTSNQISWIKASSK